LKGIRHTFLHPQWFVYKDNQKHIKEIGKVISGRVLDIGCADQYIKQYLTNSCVYVGLDYYQTATEWYHTKPNVFGDAQRLPFADETMDSVLLLDVLEHLPEPNLCLSEITRVLKCKGILVLQVPFLYPIHDAPLDFQRWTLYGLIQLAKKNGFLVKRQVLLGKGVETAGLMLNLSLCKLLSNWFQKKSPALLLTVVVVPVVIVVNVLCWLIAIVSPTDNFMPHGYRLILEKTS
jgi:SAM-dependent methyltransferase